MNKDNRTVKLTGTAILAALVIIFDYSLKYSGLKIPFPWYSNLKFDFTGIPIVMSLFLYGFSSSVFTSLVAGVGIVARSGNVVSALMKVFAELSTVIGLQIGLVILEGKTTSKYFFWIIGIVSRVLIMSVVNFYVLPNVYGVPIQATLGLLPLIGVFNVIQGLITIAFGDFLHKATRKRLPQ